MSTEKHGLDFNQTTYVLGEKGNGDPLQITLQELIQRVYGQVQDETEITQI